MKDSDWKIIETLKNSSSITQAAEALYMSQPTLTKRVQQIEREWDIEIIRRNSKGIILTPAGYCLAEYAGKLNVIFNEIPGRLEKIKKGTAGELRIGVPNSFGRFSLPALLQKYKKSYTDSSFQVITMLSSEIGKKIEEGKLDVGFVKGEVPVSCKKYYIGEEQLYIVYSREFEAEDLPDLPMITYLKDPFTQDIINTWWEEMFRTPPNIGFRVNHGDTCREMIINGLGYGLFFSDNFFRDTKQLYIRPALDRAGCPVVRNIYFIYQVEEMDALKQNFIDFVLDKRERG
ncbi:LysR family transcriptional regulator [Clostridium sp. AM58-1XD]|uniref:LysR family transcriptional regulator n=1 Tax=Clostridium sp. AM58-1XD TaxID=2292307 RepID=UPI000E546439|nr:LysR family transcriptional regulator [Clostridium sp. AM58-1XD]RGZ01205.1 LysR family transcriptional regulator [Clostridium sp. AM58-1XD]